MNLVDNRADQELAVSSAIRRPGVPAICEDLRQLSIKNIPPSGGNIIASSRGSPLISPSTFRSRSWLD